MLVVERFAGHRIARNRKVANFIQCLGQSVVLGRVMTDGFEDAKASNAAFHVGSDLNHGVDGWGEEVGKW